MTYSKDAGRTQLAQLKVIVDTGGLTDGDRKHAIRVIQLLQQQLSQP
jgi:uncharacterized Rossmann fold enzyme